MNTTSLFTTTQTAVGYLAMAIMVGVNTMPAIQQSQYNNTYAYVQEYDEQTLADQYLEMIDMLNTGYYMLETEMYRDFYYNQDPFIAEITGVPVSETWTPHDDINTYESIQWY